MWDAQATQYEIISTELVIKGEQNITQFLKGKDVH